MNIYVAGKTHDYERVRRVQEECRFHGHTITYDWTKTVEVVGPEHENGITEKQVLEAAVNDRNGVRDAELVIALGHPKLCGTLIEIGMALMSPVTRVWLVDVEQQSVFFRLKYVERISEHELPAKIRTLPEHFHEDRG